MGLLSRFSAILSLLCLCAVFYCFTYLFYCHALHSKLPLFSSNTNSYKLALIADPQMEGDARVYAQGKYGELNNYFNDLYFRHVYHNIEYFAKPDQVALLGDVFSSQYMDIAEFKSRIKRFEWNFKRNVSQTIPMILIPGNHDVGYGDEFVSTRLNIWELYMKQTPNQMHHKLNSSLTIATLDTLSLDGTMDHWTETKAWNHVKVLQKWRSENPTSKLVLLVHIPFYKPRGNCADEPRIQKYAHYVMEQTTVSEENSKKVLETIQPDLIFSGHDHEGCLYEHKIGNKLVKEMTVRSIMGDFGGNTAFLEAFTEDNQVKLHTYQCSFLPTKQLLTVVGVTIAWFALLIVLWILDVILSTIGYLFQKIFSKKAKQE